MMKKISTGSLFALSLSLAFLGLASGCQTTPPPNTLATHNSDRWLKDIAAFEASDRTNPPPVNCIVFAGSSSARMWTSLQKDFPDLPVINRGFGGSQLADSVNFASRIVTPYKPRQVVIYAGTNDIESGKDPELVFGDFVALVKAIRQEVPKARISLISIAPNPRRWGRTEQFKTFNRLAKNYCDSHSNMDFIDVFSLMLGEDGKSLPDIYLKDGLHMNEKGYAIWREAVRPYLK